MAYVDFHVSLGVDVAYMMMMMNPLHAFGECDSGVVPFKLRQEYISTLYTSFLGGVLQPCRWVLQEFHQFFGERCVRAYAMPRASSIRELHTDSELLKPNR